MDVKGSYKILGTTEASAEGMVILGFIRLGDFDKVAVFPSAPAVSSVLPIKMPAGPKTSIECAAAYKALENYPDADQVINPRWKTTVEDYVIFKKVSTTCTATAVKITHK
jgi:hypothetical protein